MDASPRKPSTGQATPLPQQNMGCSPSDARGPAKTHKDPRGPAKTHKDPPFFNVCSGSSAKAVVLWEGGWGKASQFTGG